MESFKKLSRAEMRNVVGGRVANCSTTCSGAGSCGTDCACVAYYKYEQPGPPGGVLAYNCVATTVVID